MADRNKEFVNQAILYVSLNDTVRRQASQIELMKTKNEELTMLVGYLKDIIVDLDPSMGNQLDALNI